MYGFIEGAINRSRTTLLIMAMVIIAGLISRIAIPVEGDPRVDVPLFVVTVIHEGIAPEDSERLLIMPLEVELRTVQSLPLNLRDAALTAVADPVAPGGTLLVVAWGRPDDTDPGGPPWPVSRRELDHLVAIGLEEVAFELPNDIFRVEYRRPR